MSDVEELKRMVMTFRVSELVMLLGYAGRNKTGRKQDLQARALDLAKSRNTSVVNKIRELHKTIQSQAGLTPGMNPASAADQPTYSYAPNMMQQPQQPIRGGYAHPSYLPPEYAKAASSVSPGAASLGTKIPTHPDVVLKTLPFFDVMAELMKPTSLAPSPVPGKGYNDGSFSFHLTPQQADDIASHHDGRVGAKLEFPVQIQMRLCMLETSCPQEDHFPPNITVRVNNKNCQLPNPIMSTKPGVEPRRPPKPVNITPLCRISPVCSNAVHISWAVELGRAYCTSICLVRRLSSQDLLNRLKSRGHKNADFTRGLIKEKLSAGLEDEIASTSLKCSLQCPLGKCRMQLPCRATTCQHLQCFDASLYIQMNERKPTWVCPVCDKPAFYGSLVIDGYFAEVLQQTDGSCMDVTLHEDGSWREVTKEEKEQPKVEEDDDIKEVLALEDDSGSDEVKVTEEKDAPPGKKKKEPVCVTLSDSEDEAPPPPKKRMAAAAAGSEGWKSTPVGDLKMKLSFNSGSRTTSAGEVSTSSTSSSLAALRTMSQLTSSAGTSSAASGGPPPAHSHLSAAATPGPPFYQTRAPVTSSMPYLSSLDTPSYWPPIMPQSSGGFPVSPIWSSSGVISSSSFAGSGSGLAAAPPAPPSPDIINLD